MLKIAKMVRSQTAGSRAGPLSIHRFTSRISILRQFDASLQETSRPPTDSRSITEQSLIVRKEQRQNSNFVSRGVEVT